MEGADGVTEKAVSPASKFVLAGLTILSAALLTWNVPFMIFFIHLLESPRWFDLFLAGPVIGVLVFVYGMVARPRIIPLILMNAFLAMAHLAFAWWSLRGACWGECG